MTKIATSNFTLNSTEQRSVTRSYDGDTPKGPRSFDEFATAVEQDLARLTTVDGLVAAAGNAIRFLAPAIACGAAGSFAATKIFAKAYTPFLMVQGSIICGDETASALFTGWH
ncbi:MAG: hypothetical protein Q7S68_04910, partial [Deltaproteobacteria bacterium]|nr:hypothetical protein [Deltaproteobacteria bacterium]